MAKVYSAPAELGPPPELDIKDVDGSLAREAQWVQQVRAWARANGNGEMAGAEVRWPVADGQACYVVYTERPLAFIHLPIGDAWQFQYVERMRLADIRQRVNQARALDRLFGRGDEVS